ncbi:MAG: hypothetical protein SWH78_12620 [Thermodesulfobacteriota bacterium]|nr:hypothetical protein [Thermodesulfobacteriota bacterium]
MLAPRVISSRTGIDQNPEMARRPCKARCRLYTLIFRYYPVFTAYRLLALAKNKLRGIVASRRISGESGERDQATPRMPIYGPHGSFVIFNRAYFEAGGSLDVGSFMFAETMFIAETLERLGLSAVYEPRLRVIHDEHVTMGRFKSPRVARLQWEASVYCFREFFS